MTDLITYEHLHGLGRKTPRLLHAQMAACMAVFGYAADPNETLVVLDTRGEDDMDLKAGYEELVGHYGPHPQKLRAFHTDRREWPTYLWQVPTGALDAAFTHVADLQARGGLLESRTKIKLIWKFRFRDPDTRELLPGQDTLPRLENFPGGHGDSSSVVLNLGRPSSVSFWFLFPFAEPDHVFRAYLTRLQAALPVTLSAKGWRRWSLTRSGTWRGGKVNVAPANRGTPDATHDRGPINDGV